MMVAFIDQSSALPLALSSANAIALTNRIAVHARKTSLRMGGTPPEKLIIDVILRGDCPGGWLPCRAAVYRCWGSLRSLDWIAGRRHGHVAIDHVRQGIAPHGFGDEVVHAGLDAFFAVARQRVRGHGHDLGAAARPRLAAANLARGFVAV